MLPLPAVEPAVDAPAVLPAVELPAVEVSTEAVPTQVPPRPHKPLQQGSAVQGCPRGVQLAAVVPLPLVELGPLVPLAPELVVSADPMPMQVPWMPQ